MARHRQQSHQWVASLQAEISGTAKFEKYRAGVVEQIGRDHAAQSVEPRIMHSIGERRPAPRGFDKRVRNDQHDLFSQMHGNAPGEIIGPPIDELNVLRAVQILPYGKKFIAVRVRVRVVQMHLYPVEIE